jgi:ABC-2 type transport system ATP-binding protein
MTAWRTETAPAAIHEEEVAVDVRDLVKTFPAPDGGTLTAVDHVSFTVRRGEVFGFLGPNGAGKTTTLEIIEGLQAPTSGQTLVLGLDSQRDREELKQRIGVQLQAGAYFQYLTLEEILDLFGSFYRRRLPPPELLEKVDLLPKRRALVRELSGGQAQRFSVVAAMVNDAEVLFLDEPTTGLDPQARRGLWDLMRDINAIEGKTVVLTTHYMEEAETLCDRVAIIDHGKIQALDTPLGLIRRLPTGYRIVFVTRDPVDERALRRIRGVASVDVSGDGVRTYQLEVARPEVTLPAFIDWARAKKTRLDDIQVLPATLEEVFLEMTGHRLRD